MNENELIGLLQARLRSVTDAYETLLDQGFPRMGRTVDDRDAVLGWWDDATVLVQRARAALQTAKDEGY